LPAVPDVCQHNGHIFYLICDSKEQRSSLMSYLKENGIQSTFHYIPLHSSSAGEKFGRVYNKFALTDSIAERLVRLPIYNLLDNSDVDHVVRQINKYFKNTRAVKTLAMN
jgi:dTDP-4-amino-4,6-dideoxygalactose transaminase